MTTSTSEEELQVFQVQGVLAVTLNRPKALNSLTQGMLTGLRDALDKARKSPDIRVVVLSANGRGFCAGADLSELEARSSRGDFSFAEELRSRFNPLVMEMRRLEKPVIASINGVAAGAGASLALGADIKIASEDASFICAFVRVGLAPDTGLTHLLPRALGLAKSLEHAWTAKPISSKDALACGLVNEVVPAYRLESATMAMAKKLLEAPPKAVALTKRAMNRASEASFEEALDYEAQLQDILGKTPDHREGVAAFLEKRPPKFTGE